ncbi:MAG: SPFH domain-containing protein, partial [Planctomycetota bacterium]
MTETTHTRSRRASLGGLGLHLVAFAVTLGLAYSTHSAAMLSLAWYVLGGLPAWFVALLVFRQQELAALEALDLEELRRERQAHGGGEALFDEGAGGFRVAQARLQWLQRWLVPGFSVLTAVYLAVIGGMAWRGLVREQLWIGSGDWPALEHVPVALVVLAILMTALFLFSRYASGLGRVARWQLLRGCGSFMLGNALAIIAVLIALGAYHSAQIGRWAEVLAYAIPILMLVLALETLINFVLDIYRPRVPGVEPRAAFDSRLLGLFAEPGGIASSVADAINYQFGFQVSQTWFYQLLERAFLPLVVTGALALWVLTCIVVVQPYEHVIVERFGGQLDPQNPLTPGLHIKLPWPIDVARTYNTGQLQEIHVGFKDPNAVPAFDKAAAVQLWTDEKHLGQEHFDFLLCPGQQAIRAPASQPTTRPGEGAYAGWAESQDSPVHLIRMDVTVQYRIRPNELHLYTQTLTNPDAALRHLAWEEVGRFTAAASADGLLSEQIARFGPLLRDRIAARADALQLGLEVVYVGVRSVHPERTVAEAFRNVVKAEQQKVAAIRQALVEENRTLSGVAGGARAARVLADAIAQVRAAGTEVDNALQTLAGAEPGLRADFLKRTGQHVPLMERYVEAVAAREQAGWLLADIEQDFELGLGRTLAERKLAEEAIAAAEQAVTAAKDAVDAALAPLLAE